MGIFDLVFKPNIEKMVNKGNIYGLIEALKHKNNDVRGRAILALRKIIKEPRKYNIDSALMHFGLKPNIERLIAERPPEWLEILLISLNHHDFYVRKRAAEALREILREMEVKEEEIENIISSLIEADEVEILSM